MSFNYFPVSATQRLQLVSIQTLSASAQTITFSGLDTSNVTMYRLVLDSWNHAGNSALYSVYLNADTTATNYYTQRLVWYTTTVATANTNDNTLCTTGFKPADTQPFQIDLELMRVNRISGGGFVHRIYSKFRPLSTTTLREAQNVASWDTAAAVTSLSVTSDLADGFGAGTVARLYAYM